MPMEIRLARVVNLPSGHVTFPARELGAGLHRLRLGCSSVAVSSSTGSPPGVIKLAPDVWDRLDVPYDGIRLLASQADRGELELGPTVGVLYPGRKDLSASEAMQRATFSYGDRLGMAGVMSVGFEEEIDWERRSMNGFVLDNRLGSEGRVIPARFPIPAVVRLTWSIRQDVIKRLRSQTGDRTFNWVRNIGKWQFHTLMAGVPGLRDHLPDTRLWRGPADLAAMLARYDQVFVKNTFSIKGSGVVRLRKLPDGLEVCHIDKGRMAALHFPDLAQVVPYVRQLLGAGRCIVQQGILITGKEGRALDFRILIVRDRNKGWRCAATFAKVAPDDRLIITNVANGAVECDMITNLQQHHGMTTEQARTCAERMTSLCLKAARALEAPFDPIGILGFDVAVGADNHRIWLLEVNSVPGWNYGPQLDRELARSQIEYALSLTGFPIPEDRQPT